MDDTQRSSEDKHEEAMGSHLRREPTLEEKTKEAIDEGHDADIPSNIGFVLDEAGEEKRRASIAKKGATTVDTADIEKDAPDLADNSGTDESDSDVVWWDNDKDPQNPYNWPRWRKVLNCVLISALTFVTPLASCMSSILQVFMIINLLTFIDSHVRTRCPRIDGRIQEFKSRTCLVLCFRLCSGICCGANGIRTSI